MGRTACTERQCLYNWYSLPLQGCWYVLSPTRLKKTIEISLFLVRRGSHCCRGDLVGRTTFWIVFWLACKSQSFVAVACSFLVGLRTYQHLTFTFYSMIVMNSFPILASLWIHYYRKSNRNCVHLWFNHVSCQGNLNQLRSLYSKDYNVNSLEH